MNRYAAVDIGGTSIKYGVVDAAGRVLAAGQVATEARLGPSALAEKVKKTVGRELEEFPGIVGIGVSTAGVVEPHSGRIVFANQNLPGYAGTDWKRILGSAFGLAVDVHNDVNCAAMAEAWVGAAQGVPDFFCLTVGTGIGGALFLNGRLYEGAHGRAAEIGYMRTEGADGIYENVASMSALVEQAEKRTGRREWDGKAVFRAAAEDPICGALVEEWLEKLCRGVANAALLFDPPLIVIGGGVSNEGEAFTERIRYCLARMFPDSLFWEGLAIRPAQCRNKAGIVGAAYGLAHAERAFG